MKQSSYLAIAFSFFCLILTINLLHVSAAEVREWKTSDGKYKVEAKFVEQNADEVTIERKDGKKLKVPKAKLGPDDQAYLKELEKQAAKGGAKKSDLDSFGLDDGAPPRDTTPDAKQDPKADPKNAAAQGAMDAIRIQKEKAAAEDPSALKSNNFVGETMEVRQERIKKLAIDDANFDPSEIIKQIHEPHTLPEFKTCYEFDYSEFKSSPTLDFSDDGKRLLMGFHDAKKRTLVVVDMEKKTEIRRFDFADQIMKIQLSKHGKYVAIVGKEQTVKVFLIDKDEMLYEHKAASDGKNQVLSTWFDPEETHILFFDEKRTLYRFPVGGGMGNSVPITDEMCSEDHSVFIKNSICCAHKGNSVLIASRQRANGEAKGPASVWATTIEIVFPDDKEIETGNNKLKMNLIPANPPLHTTSDVIAYPMGLIGATNLTITAQVIRKEASGIVSAYDKIAIRGYSPNSIHYIEPSGDNFFGLVLATGSVNDTRRGHLLNYAYLHESVPVLTTISPDAADGYFNQNFMCNDGSVGQKNEKEHKVRILRPTKTPQHAFWRLLEFTKKAFKEGRYKQLELVGKALLKDTQPIADFETETSHRAWLIHLITNPTGVGPKQHAQCMAEWKQIVPDSNYPDLAKSQSMMNLAWATRGSGFAATVSEENFKKFHELMESAYKLLKPIVKKKDAPPEAYEQLFRYAQAASWTMKEYEPHITAMLENSPKNTYAHCQFATTLLPRWGGEPGDSAKYAAKVADKISGDDGDMVYAIVTLSLSRMHRQGTFYPQTELDIDRALNGCDAFCKKYPESGVGQLTGMALIFHHSDPNSYITHLNRYAEFFKDEKSMFGNIEADKWPRVPINMSVSENFLYYMQEIGKMNRN